MNIHYRQSNETILMIKLFDYKQSALEDLNHHLNDISLHEMSISVLRYSMIYSLSVRGN